MAGNNFLLNKFVKKRKKETHSNYPDMHSEKFIDIESICNFLEFQDVRFLEEDANYILKDLGISGSKITFGLFEKFIESSLWN